MNVTNSDDEFEITNSIAYGFGMMGWETNGLAVFAGKSLMFFVDDVVTNGELYVKAFRDLNFNGVYDVGIDVIVIRKLTKMDAGKTIAFSLGDGDGDTILDSHEMIHGSIPTDPRNYCFNMEAVFTDIIHTTNSLVADVRFGSDLLHGSCVMTGATWSVYLGNLITTNAERIIVCFWDDVNKNLLLDEGETSIRHTLSPKGYNTFCDVQLGYGPFDGDENGLIDSWELVHGVTDPNADPDGDGMSNVQEQVIGADPLHYDGTNNLFVAATRSVDASISDNDPDGALAMFNDYYANASNMIFVTNANFWAKGIDFSCFSVRSDDPYVPFQRAGALITSNHFLLAEHWGFNIGQTLYFRGTNAQIYASTIVGLAKNKNENKFPDLMLLTLSPALPSGIVNPVPLMDHTFIDKVGTGVRIPALMLNQFKEVVIRDIQTFNPHGDNRLTRFVQHIAPLDARRALFSKSMISGDSSSPTFLLVNGKLVLVGLHSTTTRDAPVWRFIDWIRSITEVGEHASSPEIFDVSPYILEP